MNSIIQNLNKSFRFRRRTQSCRQDKTTNLRNSTTRMSSSELTTSTPLTGSSLRKYSDSSRSRVIGLSNIDPKFTSQSGLCTSTDLETSRGSIRIQHLTALNNETAGSSRCPRIENCAHFHYEFTEICGIQIELISEEEELRSLLPLDVNETGGSFLDHPTRVFSIQVSSLGKTWNIKRSIEDFYFLDRQAHQCIWDRKLSRLPLIPRGEENFKLPSNYTSYKDSVRRFFSDYIKRFSTLAGPVITCGPVLNWFDLDNRGHRLLVSEDCAINTPAVAAAYAVTRYAKQASDEISFEVGDMISVIDMPPPDESIWWRGKKGFEVGFFPCECVEVIRDKVPSGLNLPGSTPSDHNNTFKMISSSSNSSSGSEGEEEEDVVDGISPSSASSEPTKPVLRKHGKLISFFRSFILSRPTRGKLKKSGILRERVFGCDLSEHLLNTSQEIPKVLFHCAEFIESKGIIDGIYRLSGIASNIQKLRVTFDEDRVPDLYNDRSVLQDIHCVSSLLKMYFRELPNPICTYHLYEKFVEAAKSSENQRLILLRDVVQQLPPPNYRTLEYLSRHLYRVSLRGNETGMTAKNVAIVWAPNLLRSKSLEVGGVAALQGVGIQAVVTEYLIRYCELIFSEKMPTYTGSACTSSSNNSNSSSSGSQQSQETPKKSRPKSLAISTPTKLLSLEEARSRALTAASGSYVPQEQRYIEVGGGPSNLPPTYHTVIDLPNNSIRKHYSERASSRHRKSPVGWKTIFTSGKIKYKSNNKISDSEHLTNNDESEFSTTTTDEDHQKVTATASLDTSSCAMNFNATLRPVKSAESLIPQSERSFKDLSSSSSSPNSGEVKDEVASLETVTRAILKTTASRDSPKTHSRSSSHDSYFERTPLSSLSFKSSKPISSDSESPVDPKSSSLDLSEIQVNFELEENEMKIFSEDEDALMSTSFTSIDDDDDEARPSFRRISRHNSRKSDQLRIPIFKGPKEQGAPSSPVLNNNNNNNSVLNSEVSPKKKKSDFTPGTSPNANLVKRSKMETETEEIMNPSLAMSPSIKFIDDRPASAIEVDQESLSDCLEHTSNEEKEEIIQCETVAIFDEKSEKSEIKNSIEMDRLSFVFSNENDFVCNVSLNEDNLDKLVIAEIHNDPQTKNNASVAGDNEETDQEEPSISTVKELSLEVFSPDETDNTKDESSDNPIKDDQIIVESNLEDDGHSIIENSIENSSISSPIETSYSIAGATVSENESFSLTSFEDDFKPNGEEEVEQGERQDKEDTIPKLYSTSPTQVTEFKKEDPLSPPKFTSEEIIIRPFTHESVVAMEIDEDSNITFIKDPSSSTDQQHPSVLMEIEENSIKELMTAVPVHVLEDGCDEEDDEEEEEEQLGHFDYQPIQTSSCSSDSYSLLLEDIKSSGGLSTSYKKKGTQQYYTRSNSVEENNGRMSSQGIPELEAKLNESNLFKASRAVCKSEDFPKKLSKRNTETQILSPGDGGDEVPLVRRNSIHNVPYVDVNDPGTRERMERYKEERRSLFRAKYKVEDYRVGSSSGGNSSGHKANTNMVSNPSSPIKIPSPSSPSLFDITTTSESTIKDKKPPLERISTQIQNHFYSCSATTATTTNVLEHNYKNSNHTKVNDNNNLLLNNEYNTKLTKPTLSLPRKNNSPSSSSSFGLINEDVNVKERAAIFGKKSRSNEENESKRKSLPISSSNSNLRLLNNNGSSSSNSVSRSRSSNSGHLDKSPVSPNKIKNIAALFEQKS
ncbi:uncharacterized protein [Lepeophtheirus salmonis]|uniref:uncharacterized protein isoform X3 n=1 Tax=Lepeophtheirus salmonis TaxID=72036 RepID=UPI003AF3A464